MSFCHWLRSFFFFLVISFISFISQKHENPTHEFSPSSPNLHNVSFIIFLENPPQKSKIFQTHKIIVRGSSPSSPIHIFITDLHKILYESFPEKSRNIIPSSTTTTLSSPSISLNNNPEKKNCYIHCSDFNKQRIHQNSKKEAMATDSWYHTRSKPIPHSQKTPSLYIASDNVHNSNSHSKLFKLKPQSKRSPEPIIA